MYACLKGLFFSLLFCNSYSSQAQVLDSHFFHHNGGTQITVSAQDYDIKNLIAQKGIYIDHGSTDELVNLYIDQEGYDYVIGNNVKYNWSPPKKANVNMKGVNELKDYLKMDCKPAMDFYLTYEAYEEMMYGFQTMYPDICQIIEIGTLASGRKILAAQISDNINEIEEEPNFLYTSSMHGDELGGYPLMLMYIDMLLCNYGTDERLTSLVDNINIYINPLANPDGAYRGGNDSVEDAIRFNDQFADLNRNFLDPNAGAHPDNRDYQEETLAFMEFAENREIHLSCNIHGGAEVCNYPWDTFEHRHADDEWWIDVMRNYADTAQLVSPANYLSGFDNGITNGFDWYLVEGGRQDYMTYFHRAREFTLEISNRKLPNANSLPDLWSYNRSSFINYMEEATYGLHGIITDCVTGEPIVAEISIPGHDIDNSSVFSSEQNGVYYRYLAEGSYDVMITGVGYDTIMSKIDIVDKSTVILDVELCPKLSSITEESFFDDINLFIVKNKINIKGSQLPLNTEVSLYTSTGQLLHQSPIVDKSINLPNDLSAGIYIIRLEFDGQYYSQKLLFR